MRTIKLFAALASFSLLLFTSCEKDNALTTEEQLETSDEVATAVDLVEDVEEQVDLAVELRGGDGDGCPTITVTPDDKTFPRKVVIDYGDGCKGKNDRVRKGKIVVTQSKPMNETGAVREVTYVKFYIDDAKIEGSRKVTNQGNHTFKHEIVSKITFPDGKVVERKATHTFKQIAGADTPNIRLDDVFAITGGSNGVNHKGTSYSVEITKALIKKRACPWIVAGEKVVTMGDRTMTINYGDGECDRKATATLPSGETKEIRLHRWW